MNHTEGCLICGAELVYQNYEDIRFCAICKIEWYTEVCCENGHFVCNRCHITATQPSPTEDVASPSPAESSAPVDASPIAPNAKSDSSPSPWSIAEELMNAPTVHMFGPEHHIIVGIALMKSYCAATGSEARLPDALKLIEARARNVPGNICGLWGACGAAIGAGIFLSVVTETTPLSTDTYGLCNRLTARILAVIGEVGGPRCCKRNVGIAIRETVAFLDKNLGVKLEDEPHKCKVSARNKQCISDRCPFWDAAAQRPKKLTLRRKK